LRNNGRPTARLLATALGGLFATTAEAHFQLLYTPEAALNESAAIELALVFSHPFDNGFTMNMGMPEELYVVAQRGEADPRKTDLLQYLEPIE
jgi:cobalt/nickel transport protein